MEMKEKVGKLDVPDVAERLHGHVCIDLHNHKSGFTERVEVDNLVTNVVNELMNFIPLGYSAYNKIFPLYKKVYGGLMVFDGNLNENKNNIMLPSEAHLVARADQTARTGANFGTYNSEESGLIENGHRAVWDFATNQANGTIGAVARTHADHISQMFCNIVSEVLEGTSGYTRITKANGDRTLDFFGSSAGIRRTKWPVKWNNYAVTDYTIPYWPTREYETVVAYEASKHYWGDCSKIDYATGDLYTINTKYGDNSDNNLYITRWKASDGSYDHTETVLRSFETTSQENFNISKSYFLGLANFIYGGYAYVIGREPSNSSKYHMYKIRIADPTIFEEIELPDGFVSVSNTLCQISNGLVIMWLNGESSSNSSYFLFYPADDTFVRLDIRDLGNIGESAVHGMLGDSIVHFSYSSEYNYYTMLHIAQAYLGTIANITPVQKTANQSMKVTYTLTSS